MMHPVQYFDEFIGNPDTWFETLWSDLDWEKRSDAPRREYWTNLINRPYTYGKGRGERTYIAKPDHRLIITGREKILADLGFLLEGCFLNGYETSRDWLGWHSDDDTGIDHTKPIAVITVGQERNIQYRETIEPPSESNKKGTYGPVQTKMLKSGSLFLMKPGMQSNYQHRIPKADFVASPRISLTYRGLI
jgi:alkylated DNA repair dioxygenase AlkB